MKKILYSFYFLLIVSTCQAELKVLMIGNSYTGQIRKTVTNLFKAQKSEVHLEFITPGGKTLQYHITQAKTKERIQQGSWDVIILQDQSQTPALPGINKKFHQAVEGFSEFFQSLKKKPKIYFYMTWGRRDGDRRNKNIFPDFATMQKALTENYTKAAKKISADIVPVGLGFERVHLKNKELFKSLYAKDGSHPSHLGAYLAACMFYAKLLDQDPETIEWQADLDGETAMLLKQTAKKVLQNI